jgi:hypothetical protein
MKGKFENRLGVRLGTHTITHAISQIQYRMEQKNVIPCCLFDKEEFLIKGTLVSSPSSSKSESKSEVSENIS